jgi:two-component system response regulator AtoC
MGSCRKGSNGGRTRADEHSRSILIVDDDAQARQMLAPLIRRYGCESVEIASGRKLLDLLDGGVKAHLVLLDLDMPDLDGLDTLRQLREHGHGVPVLMLSSLDEARTVVEAISLGACGYLVKPVDALDLTSTLDEVLGRPLRLISENDDRLSIWEGRALQEVLKTIHQIASTDVSLLLRGETGVGKEIVAREVHATSVRAEGPFVKVHCAALPGQLLESELFGFERGAFTGAHASKAGRFELAEGGTLFLDEIGEMTPDLQAKLLQAIQDGSFSRIGANEERKVDVRVICATHRPLEKMVEEGTFRQDLYFRINVLELMIPPLRERRDEVFPLFEAFLEACSRRWGKPIPPISERVRDELKRYPFPGNVRELENMAKRVVILQDSDSLLSELNTDVRFNEDAGRAVRKVIEELEKTAGLVPLLEVGRRAAAEVEYHVLDRVLTSTGWNRKKAARMLNVSYSTLLQKIQARGLKEPGSESVPNLRA